MSSLVKIPPYSRIPLSIRRSLWELAKETNFTPEGKVQIEQRCNELNVSFPAINKMIYNYKRPYLVDHKDPIALSGKRFFDRQANDKLIRDFAIENKYQPDEATTREFCAKHQLNFNEVTKRIVDLIPIQEHCDLDCNSSLLTKGDKKGSESIYLETNAVDRRPQVEEPEPKRQRLDPTSLASDSKPLIMPSSSLVPLSILSNTASLLLETNSGAHLISTSISTIPKAVPITDNRAKLLLIFQSLSGIDDEEVKRLQAEQIALEKRQQDLALKIQAQTARKIERETLHQQCMALLEKYTL